MDDSEEKSAILLVERDNDVIETVQLCLGDDLELHVANTVELALRIAVRRPIAISVIDAAMAGMRPVDTVQRLRATSPSMRVILLATQQQQLERRLTQLGPVLRKPLTTDRFAEALRYTRRLQGMTNGVKRMRDSSGTFPAVRPLDARLSDRPEPAPAPPAADTNRTTPPSVRAPIRVKT